VKYNDRLTAIAVLIANSEEATLNLAPADASSSRAAYRLSLARLGVTSEEISEASRRMREFVYPIGSGSRATDKLDDLFEEWSKADAPTV
jgi:hypothetical protein